MGQPVWSGLCPARQSFQRLHVAAPSEPCVRFSLTRLSTGPSPAPAAPAAPRFPVAPVWATHPPAPTQRLSPPSVAAGGAGRWAGCGPGSARPALPRTGPVSRTSGRAARGGSNASTLADTAPAAGGTPPAPVAVGPGVPPTRALARETADTPSYSASATPHGSLSGSRSRAPAGGEIPGSRTLPLGRSPPASSPG